MIISKLLLFGAMFVFLKLLLKISLIKVFKVNQEPYHKDFVNRTHQIIHNIVVAITILIFLLLYYLLEIDTISQMFFLGICIFLMAFPSAIEAYFWWKDDQKSRYFVLCIGEALLFIIVGITVWQFGIFGLTSI